MPDPSPDRPPRDRRRWPRHPPGGPNLRLSLSPAPDGPGFPAVVEDFSAGGAGLVVARPLEPGARLVATVRLLSGRACWSRELEVVEAVAQPGGLWRLSCRFCPPLTPEELRQVLGYAPPARPEG